MQHYRISLLAGCAALLAVTAQAQNPARTDARDVDARETVSEEYRQSLTYRDYLKGNDLRASELIGAQVHNPEGENLGEIKELVMASGKDMVVISVGGVLNVGDKLVAVPYEELRVSPDGDTFYVNRTKEQLEAAPAHSYERRTTQPQQAAAAPAARATDDDVTSRAAVTRETDQDTEIQREVSEAQREIQRETNEAQREIQRAANAAERDVETDSNERSASADQRDVNRVERDNDANDRGDVQRESAQPSVSSSTQRPRPTAAATAATALGSGDYRGSDLIGAPVLDSTGEKIAQIDDLVLSTRDNKIHAVLSVGGVAGIGSKLVSVPLADLKIVTAEDPDSLTVRVETTADQLESKPEFHYERRVALERAAGPGA
jgi:sporulation protein YlmC with PRC-barrel domain